MSESDSRLSYPPVWRKLHAEGADGYDSLQAEVDMMVNVYHLSLTKDSESFVNLVKRVTMMFVYICSTTDDLSEIYDNIEYKYVCDVAYNTSELVGAEWFVKALRCNLFIEFRNRNLTSSLRSFLLLKKHLHNFVESSSLQDAFRTSWPEAYDKE